MGALRRYENALQSIQNFTERDFDFNRYVAKPLTVFAAVAETYAAHSNIPTLQNTVTGDAGALILGAIAGVSTYLGLKILVHSMEKSIKNKNPIYALGAAVLFLGIGLNNALTPMDAPVDRLTFHLKQPVVKLVEKVNQRKAPILADRWVPMPF